MQRKRADKKVVIMAGKSEEEGGLYDLKHTFPGTLNIYV